MSTTTADKILSQLLRQFFHLLYHQFAWCYDIVAWVVSFGQWDLWIAEVLPYLNGPRILELGYGTGHLQTALQQKYEFAAGIDASFDMARISRSRLRRLGYRNTAAVGYAHALPFGDASFSQVVATFPTDYIFDRVALSEIDRILIPQGDLVILPFAWITGTRWYERWMARLFRFTHQSPEYDDRIAAPLMDAGFHTRLIVVNLDSSSLLIIKASKAFEDDQTRNNNASS